MRDCRGGGTMGSMLDALPLRSSRRSPLSLDAILDQHLVSAVFQPIVRLSDGVPVGHETLSRGPTGSPLESPAALFELATAHGRLAELERLCHRTALNAARSARFTSADALFVNVEPDATAADEVLFGQHLTDADIVLEISERHSFRSPRNLMQAIERARERGWRIALDDVGASPASLALLTLVDPDFIKLDRRLLQEPPTADLLAQIAAVRAVGEASGALVIAEGVETSEQERYARTIGADLAQGWLYGAPSAAVVPAGTTLTDAVARRRRRTSRARTPFELLAERQAPRSADPAFVTAMARLVQDQALAQSPAPIVLLNLAGGSDAGQLIASPARLAERSLFAAAVGGLETDPALGGLRGGRVDTDHPLCEELAVVVLAPHFSAAVAARPARAAGEVGYVLSYDRDLVASAAERLIRHVDCAP